MCYKVCGRREHSNYKGPKKISVGRGKGRVEGGAAEKAAWLEEGELEAAIGVQARGYGNLESRCHGRA